MILQVLRAVLNITSVLSVIAIIVGLLRKKLFLVFALCVIPLVLVIYFHLYCLVALFNVLEFCPSIFSRYNDSRFILFFSTLELEEPLLLVPLSHWIYIVPHNSSLGIHPQIYE